jgi:hypothetical protein
MQAPSSNSGNNLIGIWLGSVANVFATNHDLPLLAIRNGFAATWNIGCALAVVSTHSHQLLQTRPHHQFLEMNTKSAGLRSFLCDANDKPKRSVGANCQVARWTAAMFVLFDQRRRTAVAATAEPPVRAVSIRELDPHDPILAIQGDEMEAKISSRQNRRRALAAGSVFPGLGVVTALGRASSKVSFISIFVLTSASICLK